MTVENSWSYRHLMDTLEAAEQGVVIEAKANLGAKLRIYRWRPTKPQLPCIYHVFSVDTVQTPDLARIRDTAQVMARIAIRRADDAARVDHLMDLADIFRDVMDPLLFQRPPLGGTTAKWAERTGARWLDDEFSGVHAQAMEFPLSFQLDRPATAIP